MDDQQTTGTSDRRRFRKLRIAWSVGWGIACLLLVALWVRSYRYWDQLYNPISKQMDLVIVESASGGVIVRLTTGQVGGRWKRHMSRDLRSGSAGGATRDWNETYRDKEIGGFAYHVTPWHTTFRAPLWFPAVLFAALSALPWIRWRFSLRTLLIAMTLIAVGLGLAVYAAR
jgi:hypothetical protein